MKISEAFGLYISDCMEVEGQSRNYINHFKKCGRDLVEFLGDIKLRRLTVSDVSRWKNNMIERGDRCNNTIRDYIGQLRIVLRYWGIRGEKCIDYKLIPLPKEDKTLPAYLTREEVQHMIDSTPLLRSKFIIAMLYGSGVRLSELLSLDIDDIRDGSFSVIGKGGKPRLCFIDDRAEQLMYEYLSTRKDNNQFLLATRDGSRRMSPTNVQLLVRNARKRAGLKDDVTPHTLRHSFATDFLRNNGNMRQLATLMGHSNINTTAHYSHVIDKDLHAIYKASHRF